MNLLIGRNARFAGWRFQAFLFGLLLGFAQARLSATTEEVELSSLDRRDIGRYVVVQTDRPGRAEKMRRVLPAWAVWDGPEGLIFAGRLDGILRDSLLMTAPVAGSDSRKEVSVSKAQVVKMWMKDDYGYRAAVDRIEERREGLEVWLSLRKRDRMNGGAHFIIPPESAYYWWLRGEMARADAEQIYYRIVLNIPIPRARTWPVLNLGMVTRQTAKDMAELDRDRSTQMLRDGDIVSMHGITQNEYLQVQPRIVRP